MESKKQASIMRAAITAAIVVAAILIVGSFWNGKSAGADTEKAVRSVSLLYLNELAERREQVVSARIADYISDMDIAVPRDSSTPPAEPAPTSNCTTSTTTTSRNPRFPLRM